MRSVLRGMEHKEEDLERRMVLLHHWDWVKHWEGVEELT